MKILSSASKMVLLSIVFGLVLMAVFAGVWSVISGEFTKPVEVILGFFGTALTFVLGFYFGSKGDPSQPNLGK